MKIIESHTIFLANCTPSSRKWNITQANIELFINSQYWMELRSVLTPAIDCMLMMSYDFWMMEPFVPAPFVILYKWFFTFLKCLYYLILFSNTALYFLFCLYNIMLWGFPFWFHTDHTVGVNRFVYVLNPSEK